MNDRIIELQLIGWIKILVDFPGPGLAYICKAEFLFAKNTTVKRLQGPETLLTINDKVPVSARLLIKEYPWQAVPLIMTL
jgi:hypothetical protein